MPRLIETLVSLFCDADEGVVLAAWTALGAVTGAVAKERQALYLRDVRAAVQGAREKIRRRLRDAGARPSPLLVPGLCLPKGLAPVAQVYLQGVLAGRNADARESAAEGLREATLSTTAAAVKPHVIPITGPLIRVLGDKHPGSVKSAVLGALAAMIDVGGAALKPFVPQLQTTFVKCLLDPARAVRREPRRRWARAGRAPAARRRARVADLTAPWKPPAKAAGGARRAPGGCAPSPARWRTPAPTSSRPPSPPRASPRSGSAATPRTTRRARRRRSRSRTPPPGSRRRRAPTWPSSWARRRARAPTRAAPRARRLRRWRACTPRWSWCRTPPRRSTGSPGTHATPSASARASPPCLAWGDSRAPPPSKTARRVLFWERWLPRWRARCATSAAGARAAAAAALSRLCAASPDAVAPHLGAFVPALADVAAADKSKDARFHADRAVRAGAARARRGGRARLCAGEAARRRRGARRARGCQTWFCGA